MGKVLGIILFIVVGALCVYEIVSLIRQIVERVKNKNKIKKEQVDNGTEHFN